MNVQPGLDPFLSLEAPLPRPRRRHGLRLTVLVAVVLGIGFAGLRYFYPHAVEGEILRSGMLDVELRGPGTLSALTEASVGSRIQARIEELAVDRNDVVAKGETLARLAFDDLSGEVDAAEASAHAAERGVGAAQAERDRALATLEQARATHERQVALLAKGVSSAAGLEDALAARRQAEADIARAGRAIEQAEAEHDAAKARIAVARVQLDDSVLRAPISGVVVSRTRHVGEVLAPGSELLHLVDPESLVLTARLDESAISAVRSGQAAEITFTRAEDTIRGHVLRLGREVDRETREFEIDIALDTVPANWALGQRAMARIILERRGPLLTVPTSYLVWRDGRPGVWIASRGRARWREVTLGEAGARRVEIRRGLDAGQEILKPDDLYPFMRVRLAGAAP
ncbi:efflux RND transporter periplasmic adaptor subunit [Ancylobacter sp. SL191]|uniref:efflux RND transporter periplasmic adaptor subunit n=1 Tax=Ancylobacter sp. SL191 TaxID=2995166 RepID=UPI00226E8ACC|nr:efflux RND transporter periplasmic adaptor subunit [Ancylobacter sp. SL191]WAC26525.1 efflux RND transporter periplasmic adaptor subunit [Ancylobacter sp. SL191]